MAISGGTAGLAGGVRLRALRSALYQQSFSPGFGFDAMVVRCSPTTTPWASSFQASSSAPWRFGSNMMQITAKIPSVLVFFIQGLVILAVVAFGVYRQRSMQES